MQDSGHRQQHLANKVKRQLSESLLRDLRDPEVGFVTITSVEMSRDLRIARVFASVLGDADRAAEAVKALQRASRFLERELFRRLRLRTSMELRFSLDDRAEQVSRIEEILKLADRKETTEESDP
ncbi:MAG: 30S ribosome-binding factor RbfA [Acidobacteriota bacterium]